MASCPPISATPATRRGRGTSGPPGTRQAPNCRDRTPLLAPAGRVSSPCQTANRPAERKHQGIWLAAYFCKHIAGPGSL
jgi:hypothetical protein